MEVGEEERPGRVEMPGLCEEVDRGVEEGRGGVEIGFIRRPEIESVDGFGGELEGLNEGLDEGGIGLDACVV